ncbi:MAG: glycosyltransferase [Bacteroidales bacterium]|nr:glycosyltransferase [Bacteroidales bacterium]
MENRHINIVSFSIPFPANYGGVIDVYHKLVALHAIGIRIHLHCFRYDRQPAPELDSLCETIHYYPRLTGVAVHLSTLPYIVRGRNNPELLKNLLANDYPILFEGLHSCYFLNHPALKGRKLIYRESNIEHHYYYHLFRAEKKISHKLFFLLESIKLKLFQSKLSHASAMLAVSEKDTEYLQNRFPGKEVHYLPSFHGNIEPSGKPGMSNYAFYHGNLAVSENTLAAEFLIKEVFNDLEIPLIIAGLNPPQSLRDLAVQYNITIFANTSTEKMEELLREAQVNVLITFQATGLKLKLLNTLFKGRHVLVNSKMLAGTGLDDLCEKAEDASGLKIELKRLIHTPFDGKTSEQRAKILTERYSDKVNAKKLLEYLF